MSKKLPIEELDIELEPTEEVVTDEASSSKMKKLRAELKASKEKSAEYLAGWQRDKADFVNSRKRDEESRNYFVRFAKEGIINDLLPAIDSFDIAMSNKEVWEKVDKVWRTGIEHIYSQLQQVLTDNGVTVINPENEMFSPSEHDSVDTEKTDDVSKDGKISSVISKGYKMGEKIVRPARVKVYEIGGRNAGEAK